MSSFSFAVAYWLGLLIRSDSHSTSVAVLVLSSTSLIRDHRSNWLLHYFGMESNFETKGGVLVEEGEWIGSYSPSS